MAIKKNNKKSINGKKYVVQRDGFRVSDIEYISAEDAADEYGFWKRAIANGRDYTSKLEIVAK